MKKFMSTLVTMAVMAMPLFVTQAYAVEDIPQMQVESVSAEPGESIDVAVELINNPGIIATSFTISYDNECLELTGVDDAKLFADMAFTPSGDITLIPFRLMWDSLATENYIDNGTMAILHFNVLDTASAGLTEIEINVETENTFDVNLDEVAIEPVNGGIEIKGEEITTTDTSTTTTTSTTTLTTTSATTSAITSTHISTTTTTTSTESTTKTTTSTTEISTNTTTSETLSDTSVSTTETTVTETESETTTSTTTTETSAPVKTEITTTTAVTIDESEYFVSIEEMCNMASEDYKQKKGSAPESTKTERNEDGTISIKLLDKNGKILDTYIIDPITGVGTGKDGSEINLPQTGNNAPANIIAVTTATALLTVGAYTVLKSGILRKKDDEEV